MSMSKLKDEAQALYLRRRYAECVRAYQRLTELEPGDAHLHLRHAEACRRADKPLQAAAAFRSAARVLASQGQLARACAALKVALELEPDHTGAQVARAALERQRAAGLPPRSTQEPAPTALPRVQDLELPPRGAW
jgi:tetratricopeptide (TPR) repeat protein